MRPVRKHLCRFLSAEKCQQRHVSSLSRCIAYVQTEKNHLGVCLFAQDDVPYPSATRTFASSLFLGLYAYQCKRKWAAWRSGLDLTLVAPGASVIFIDPPIPPAIECLFSGFCSSSSLLVLAFSAKRYFFSLSASPIPIRLLPPPSSPHPV